MEISIPTTLKALSATGAAARSIGSWWSKSKGESRALIGELKDNLLYLDMVANDNVPLTDVVDKMSTAEFTRLSKDGFNFNKLRSKRIPHYASLENTDLAQWRGKATEQLIFSIYEKINEIKIKFPHVGDRKNYRWSIRVNNVRKRIWLLIRHVSD
jgi:hypothetical protein